MSMDWFRWWHGTGNDPKFRVIARDCDIPVASVIGIWAIILESASTNSERGSLEIDFEVLDYQIGMDNSKKIIDSMCKRGLLIDVTPCNANVTPSNIDVTLQSVTRFFTVKKWSERQPKRERQDDSSERVKKHRDAKKSKENQSDEENDDCSDGDVTPCNAKKRIDKIRLDIKKEKESASVNAGEICAEFVQMGMKRTNPQHLLLIELIDQGIGREHLIFGMSEALAREMPFAYGLKAAASAFKNPEKFNPKPQNNSKEFKSPSNSRQAQREKYKEDMNNLINKVKNNGSAYHGTKSADPRDITGECEIVTD